MPRIRRKGKTSDQYWQEIFEAGERRKEKKKAKDEAFRKRVDDLSRRQKEKGL